MGRDDLEGHWRKPGEGDIAEWIREFRVRTHDIANWASRMEGEVLEVKQAVAQIGTSDEIADKVADKVAARMKTRFVSFVGWTPRLVAVGVTVMSFITMIRTF